MATDRTGLYIMMIITMLSSCSADDKIDKLASAIKHQAKPVIPIEQPTQQEEE